MDNTGCSRTRTAGRRRRRVHWVAAAGLLIAGACGDDKKPTLSPVSTTEGGATVTTLTVATSAPASTTPVPAGPTTTLSAVPPELDSPKLTDSSTVTTAGIAPLTFGMTVAQAQPAIGTRLLTESGGAPSGECFYVKPERGPAGVFMMVSKSTIERVDIRSGNVKTRSGLGIGTTLDQLKTALKEQLQINGNTATFVPTSANDANYRVIFETDGAKVITYRAGKVPEVTNPVGCS